MANEINIQAALAMAGDGIGLQASGSKAITQTGLKGLVSLVSVTTSSTTISFTGLSTLGCLFVKNLDTGSLTVELNLVTDFTTSPQIFAKLKAGEFCLIPVNKTSVPTLYAKASGTLSLQIVAAEI